MKASMKRQGGEGLKTCVNLVLEAPHLPLVVDSTRLSTRGAEIASLRIRNPKTKMQF